MHCCVAYTPAASFEEVPVHSRDIIKRLKDDGWVRVKGTDGSHQQFKHPIKKGRVTVPHPNKDVAIGTLRNIWKQAGF
ncbi:type II toxin-antitoxin system HicA family toxin [Pseudomonas putida]|uniref:type II toxin-antitoxin system HicA family toxin n=1 Tax=Pseudomonas putida TaxID=303 RepID=UPI001E311A94|nr:type II toxin-antitoxin system HicA family toxin [Pseudomonas putida]